MLADGLDDETPAGCPAVLYLPVDGEPRTITSLEAPTCPFRHAARRTVDMYFFFGASAIMTSVESSKPRHRGRVLQRQARDLGRSEGFQRARQLVQHKPVGVAMPWPLSWVRLRLGAGATDRNALALAVIPVRC